MWPKAFLHSELLDTVQKQGFIVLYWLSYINAFNVLNQNSPHCKKFEQHPLRPKSRLMYGGTTTTSSMLPHYSVSVTQGHHDHTAFLHYDAGTYLEIFKRQAQHMHLEVGKQGQITSIHISV